MRPTIPALQPTHIPELNDPYEGVFQDKNRVARDASGNLYIWLWYNNQVGWVFAGEDLENAQRLLELPVHKEMQ